MGHDFNDAEERTTSYWNFKDQAVVEGVLKEIIEGENGLEFKLKLDDGREVTIGSYATLQKKLSANDISHPVQITFVDETKGKNKRNYMNFKVLVSKNIVK